MLKKRHLLIIVFLFISFIGKTQEVSVERSIFGVQTGLLGVWIFHELKMTNSIALRSEIGYGSRLWGGSYFDNTGFLMTPVLSLEPRFYYNLKRRVSISKSITNNSGNYVSLKISYHPDWFMISDYGERKIVNDISIIPTWGIRRHIGMHFNYETGLGIGFRHLFGESMKYYDVENDIAVNINIRVGYTF